MQKDSVLVYIYFCQIFVEKNINKDKEAVVGPFSQKNCKN